MYTPKAFRADDIDTLHAFMQEYNFAALVTQQNGELLASHLPFLLDTQRGPYGTLMAHMARANPQWRTLAGTAEVLVIFQGPFSEIWTFMDKPSLSGSVPASTREVSLSHAAHRSASAPLSTGVIFRRNSP